MKKTRPNFGKKFELDRKFVLNNFMDAIELIKQFKIRFDPFLEEYFKKKIKKAGEIDSVAEETIHMVKDYTLAGGKRIRPAMLYYGYLAAGGENNDEIMRVSMSVELLHSFLLIHDDVIDRDASRHGVATIHERFKKISAKYGVSSDHEHFGNSMAMITGDMTAAMACDIIFNSGFPDSVIIKALDKMQDIVFVTIPGEMLDVIMQYSGRATEKEILKMFEGKTARYTFEGPLHLGCILAGGDEKLFQCFSEYSLPLGKAFQIRDDILGVYGDEKKLGKPVGSDIIEGKQTLLILKVMEKGTKEQKEIIKKYLGKKDLTAPELEKVREVIKESGSLEYSYGLCRELIEESLVALQRADIKNQEARTFLEGIAQYVIKREI
jgi:geranylgeranyl diphosphate synthase, type I